MELQFPYDVKYYGKATGKSVFSGINIKGILKIERFYSRFTSYIITEDDEQHEVYWSTVRVESIFELLNF